MERRCWGEIFTQSNVTNAIKHSTCEPCHGRPTYHSIPPTNASKIAILVSPWQHVSREGMIHPIVALAANWIIRGNFVDLIYLYDKSCHNETPTEMMAKIANRIMNSLPCNAVMAGKQPFVSKAIDMEGLGLCTETTQVTVLLDDSAPFAHWRLVAPMVAVMDELLEESSRYEVVVVSYD